MTIDKLRKTVIKNCICYYFNGIININDIDLYNILIDEKSYKNIFIYHVTYIVKPLLIIFSEVNDYVKDYDGNKYVKLFPSDEKHVRMPDKTKCLVRNMESNISDICCDK